MTNAGVRFLQEAREAYLEHAYAELQEQRAMEGQPFTPEDLYAAIMSGAVERVRPKMMTVFAIVAGEWPGRCLFRG